jgi:hypothetical protein
VKEMGLEVEEVGETEVEGKAEEAEVKGVKEGVKEVDLEVEMGEVEVVG